MLPMYLPLTLDEAPVSQETPIFYGGINVYLQHKFSIFRYTPLWLDRLLNHRGLLKRAARQSGMTGGPEIGDLTHSMLLGEDGKQAKELEKLIEWLKEHGKPDAIWLSTALLVGLARRMKQELGVPVFCSLQGEDSFLDTLVEPWRTRCWDALGERGRDVDLFVAPSRYFAELMERRMKLPPERVRVIHNGISLEGFEEPGTPPQPPAIGYLARFIEGKGLGLVVDAFIELKKRGRFPDVKLRCAGTMTAEDKRYLEKVQGRLVAAGLAQDAEFQPNISREAKIDFLKNLTLLSVPATYGEAFGLYLVEALAAGVPVVKPRHAAFPEIVEATGGGILCEPENPRALADAWETLLGDPARARALGLQGREVVLRDFSMERMADRFLEVTREKVDAAGAVL
jgi:glycosyltransferase involved in cell wall biosynthesis